MKWKCKAVDTSESLAQHLAYTMDLKTSFIRLLRQRENKSVMEHQHGLFDSSWVVYNPTASIRVQT
jgi:hypothetical protein